MREKTKGIVLEFGCLLFVGGECKLVVTFKFLACKGNRGDLVRFVPSADGS